MLIISCLSPPAIRPESYSGHSSNREPSSSSHGSHSISGSGSRVTRHSSFSSASALVFLALALLSFFSCGQFHDIWPSSPQLKHVFVSFDDLTFRSSVVS